MFIKGGAGCQLKKWFFFFPEAFRRWEGGVLSVWPLLPRRVVGVSAKVKIAQPFVENSPPAKEGCPKGGVVVSSSFSA